ncbi:MAG TPA: GerMN domain-containing protein [Spirochaetia bacterium]|nr:GerMN domain-containing protein [Spirochaetia bacterium]
MKQKRSHVGCLFWVALILLLVVVFLFNRPKIAEVLKSTGLTSLVTKQTTQPSAPSITRVPNNEIHTKPEVTLTPAPAPSSRPKAQPAPPSVEPPRSGAPSPTTSSPQQPSGNASPPASSTTTAAPQQPGNKTIARTFQLYFVKMNEQGKPVVKPMAKEIKYIDSPLTKTFDTLLEGAGTGSGFQSLIPEGTKLLSASVRDGTAYLDFNDRFRFNSYGVEGYNAQLEQVVFTATQFQTVRRVQILLDGQVRRFLAPEGIAIDKPLDRKSFQGSTSAATVSRSTSSSTL